MASTETTSAAVRSGADTAADGTAARAGDIAGLEAGLDALESRVVDRQPWLRTAASKAFPRSSRSSSCSDCGSSPTTSS